MKISMPMMIVLGAALAVGCAAPALARPNPAVPQYQETERHQAYSDGYAHGQGDARADVDRNDYPTAEWTTDVNRAAYRSGYNAGYDEVRAAGPAPDHMGYPKAEQARQFGYDDGLAAGQQDRNRGNQFNPPNHDMYKSATHGWDAALGAQYDYRQIYRDSFVKGYEAGYGGD